ncbi:MAG: META domain-containing protein, partial [Thermoleophilia bacterium]|nr:META domain-containing protein [Thermoleophilia bacterium]
MTRTLSTRRLAALALSIAAAAALLVLAGCGDDGAEGGSDGGGGDTDSAALDGTDWSLVRWRETGLDPADFTITASFADGSISGTSAVNTYSGSYTTGGVNDFSVGQIASTMMAGPEPDMEAEAA